MTPDQTAEIIATETNLKVLETYRACDMPNYHIAKIIDASLVDLSNRILTALGQMPDIDEQTETPPTEQDPLRTPYPDPAEIHDHPGAPISGDAPALFKKSEHRATVDDMKAEDPTAEIGPRLPLEKITESNETPAAADQQQALSPGADTVPEPAACGAEPGTPKKKSSKMKTKIPDPKDLAFVDQLAQWKAEENLSNMEIQRRSGVSNVIVHNILSGLTKKPSKKTQDKLLKVINAKPKKKAFKTPAPTNKVAKQAKINGKVNGHAQFVQRNFMTWKGQNKLGVADAAAKLQFEEKVIRSLMAGTMPNKFVLTVLGHYIPEIHNNMAELVKGVQA